MQNELFCDAISETLRCSDNEFDTYTVSSADHVVEEIGRASCRERV